MIMETPLVSTHRNLPTHHPIFKLLYPHFKFHLGINAIAKESLITPVGVLVEAGPLTYNSLMEVIKRSFKSWNWDLAGFPGMLKSRGFSPDGKDAPANYYYVHDGLLLWNAIKDFVTRIVDVYYKDDSVIVKDTDLQSWATEIHVGFGPSKKFPSKITHKTQLVEILSGIIFTVSVQHAVLNFSQYESFSFIPASPGALMAPPPGHGKTRVVKGTLQLNDIFNALPSKAVAARQVAVLYLLSQYSSSDNMLGNYPEELFTEPLAKDCIAQFQANLSHISNHIKKRASWDHLLPEKIPNSTAI